MTVALATDGKHSWWAWVAVGAVTIVSVVVAVWLARQARPEEAREENRAPANNVQNITASASGATAQGAMYGNVINHPTPPGAAEETPNADFRVGDSAQPHRLERHTSCDSRGLLTCGYARSAAQTFST
ncbi:MAG: hypothetical protein ACR2G2_19780, partial [Pseudonocardia sp.]